MRARILLASTLILTVLTLAPFAWSQSQRTFYLYADSLLDEHAATQTVTNVIRLGGDIRWFFWNTSDFFSEQSFPAGVWNVILWMNITKSPTQYRVKLGVNNQSGSLVDLFLEPTPIINSPSPSQYQVTMALPAFKIRAGGSLVLGLLRQWQNTTASNATCIFFGSSNMPSRIVSPEISQPSPSPAGFGFAVIGIGAGISAVGAVVAFAASGRSAPHSEVFAYGGSYYCRKHRVPVLYFQGWLWCPVERRYLRP